MKINIPFNSWSKIRIINGKKSATSRYKKYGESGDTFTIGKTDYILNGVMKSRLADVAKRFYTDEGCDTPEEFKEIWTEIHPRRGFRPDDIIWIHFFLPEGIT